MLAGSFHAPIFGALMIFEMAGSYEMLELLVMAAAIGFGIFAPLPAGLGLHGGAPRARDLPCTGHVPSDGRPGVAGATHDASRERATDRHHPAGDPTLMSVPSKPSGRS